MPFEPTDYLPYDFANRRHIEPSPSEMAAMLEVMGLPTELAHLAATTGHTADHTADNSAQYGIALPDVIADHSADNCTTCGAYYGSFLFVVCVLNRITTQHQGHGKEDG